jgi:hypothetical protein
MLKQELLMLDKDIAMKNTYTLPLENTIEENAKLWAEHYNNLIEHVSLDYLVSDSEQEEALDNEAVRRIKEIQTLPPQEKDKVFSVVDALIRDFKTKQAYK